VGTTPPDLAGALRDAARKAASCYNRALRTIKAQGSVMVKLQVTASGVVCRTEIESSSPEVATLTPCLRTLFEGKQLPSPAGGCVNVNIPLVFSIKDANDGGSPVPDGGAP
jgi:hypothetical protein